MIYDIKCKTKDCNYKNELFCNIAQKEKELKKPCPKCGEKNLYHAVKRMTYKLKGNGWAKHGYC